MPVTEHQRTVLRLIARHRNPDSYVAGGTAINRSAESLRYSRDIDLFHDAIESVGISAEQDLELLKKSGYQVDVSLQQPGIVRASVQKGKQALKLEWVVDSAFRFFPVVEDQDFGYRLHDADLATNKCLALANRTQIRDVLDLFQIHRSYLCLAATCWAACGKDPGFTPDLLLEYLRRNSRISPDLLVAEELAAPLDPRKLKHDWLALLDEAQDTIGQFPSADLGCLYLDKLGAPVRAPDVKHIDLYLKHFGTVHGSWPRVG